MRREYVAPIFIDSEKSYCENKYKDFPTVSIIPKTENERIKRSIKNDIYFLNNALQFKRNHLKLITFSELKDNWNGRGSDKIPNNVIDTVFDILNKVTDQPDIFPLSTGGIQLEWESYSGNKYLEIDVLPEKPNMIEVYMDLNGKETELEDNVECVQKYVDKLGIKVTDSLFPSFFHD